MLKEGKNMNNQSCGCQGMNTRPCGCGNTAGQGCGCQNTSKPNCGCNMNMNTCGCGMNMNAMNGCGMGMNNCGCSINGCPRPQPLVAPKRVCVTNQVTCVPQPVICPIECRRVNRCQYYPVFYPQYEQTFVNESSNQSY